MELKLQLQHERLLRDEAEKRSIIGEFIASLERLNSVVQRATSSHLHPEVGTSPGESCSATSMTDIYSAGLHFHDLFLSKSFLVPVDLSLPFEIWEYIFIYPDEHFIEYYYELGHVRREEYCEPGGRVACLEITARNCIISLRSELKKLEAIV